ncbi:MAG: FKBP-type peptidyl-prolyl cis-trans isomerase [Thiotrichales bacterium]
MSESIGLDSEVTMHFTLALENGTVVDATEEDEPMSFTMGDGSMINGLEMALIGLKAGEEQTLTIPAVTGFGFPDPEAVKPIPLSDFAPDLQPVEGYVMSFTLPNGDEIPGTIVEIKDDQALVDLNHPLAGKDVVFTVKILQVTNKG